MPRRPRIQLDGIPLHIVQLGQNREPCFFSEEDYASYLHWLGEALRENAINGPGSNSPREKPQTLAFKRFFEHFQLTTPASTRVLAPEWTNCV